jgi:hypothetical protein
MNNLSTQERNEVSASEVNAISMSAEQERAMQEIQSAMIVAKRFPRDMQLASRKIADSCKRKTLAMKGLYSYPRGKKTVSGPSIRLAEVLAQNWGNMIFGVRELATDLVRKESRVEAFAWDLETNTRQMKQFTVSHKYKVNNEIKVKTDPRDIYEHVANMGARRMRACILGIIPADIVEDAVKECRQTMTTGHTEPLKDRIKKIVPVFAQFGVTQDDIETKYGKKMDALDEYNIADLLGIHEALKDKMGSCEDYFKPKTAPIPKENISVNDVLSANNESSESQSDTSGGSAQSAISNENSHSEDSPPNNEVMTPEEIEVVELHEELEMLRSKGHDIFTEACQELNISRYKAIKDASRLQDLIDNVKLRLGA